MINPFTIKVISDPKSFCNRIKEQEDLISFAKSQTNVVLYSPRRYGKTSLVRLVQNKLAKNHNALISYVDLFAVSSIDDVAQRIAKSIYQMLQPHETLFKKSIKLLTYPIPPPS
jgi:AAA+ ATPase superfamily predicted ATPase